MITHLPATSRVWFFGADQVLSAEHKELLNQLLLEFVQDWKSHGTDLSAGFQILHDVAVIIAVDETKTPPSGCSIDKAFRLLQNFQVDFFQRTLIWQPFCNTAKIFKLNEVRTAYENHEISPETLVLNSTVANLIDARNNLYIPFSQCWAFTKIKP